MAKLIFSGKEAASKAWALHVRTILEFEDVELQVDTEAGRLEATLCRKGLPAPTATLYGAFARGDEALITAMSMPAAPG